MPKYVVSATGQAAQTLRAANWLEALGAAVSAMGLLDGMEALACEILPNHTVVARNVKTGQGFVVMPAEADTSGTPAPVTRRNEGLASEPFGVGGLAGAVFQQNLEHELRTPLNAIVGYAGMLLEEAQDRGLLDMVEDLRRLASSATALQELIDAGLEAERVVRGELKVQRLTFRIRELLHDAGMAFEAQRGRGARRVEILAAPGLGEMRADPSLLRGALLELLRWAADRTDHEVLTLTARVENDAENAEWVRIWVDDGERPVSDEEAAGLFQVMVGTTGPEGSAAATIRRGTQRELCRKQGGDLLLSAGPRGARTLGVIVPRGR